MITLAYHSGFREGELLDLGWTPVGIVARIVRLERAETRNKEPRTIPFIREPHTMMQLLQKACDQRWPYCPWVFSRYGTQILDLRGA